MLLISGNPPVLQRCLLWSQSQMWSLIKKMFWLNVPLTFEICAFLVSKHLWYVEILMWYYSRTKSTQLRKVWYLKIVSDNDLTRRWQAPAMGAVSQSKLSSITLDENNTKEKDVKTWTIQGPVHWAVWLPLLWRGVQIWKAGKNWPGKG